MASPLKGSATTSPILIQWASALVLYSGSEAITARSSAAAGRLPESQPQYDRPIDMVGQVVPPPAGGLCDRGIEQIGSDGDLRAQAEGRDQQGRHQCAAADAGQADEEADAEPSRDQRQHLA